MLVLRKSVIRSKVEFYVAVTWKEEFLANMLKIAEFF
jgi:hypothetical protein